MSKIPLHEVIALSDHLFNAGKRAGIGTHLRHWLNEAQMAGDRESELSILNELMGHYRMSNDPARGLEAVAAGVKLLDELHQAETVSGGTILLNAATALQAFGRYDEAEELYLRAYRAYTLHLPDKDGRFAGLFNNMASIYAAKGDIDTAEAYYLEAMEVLRDSGKAMDMAVTWVNLAQLGRDTANCLERARAIFDDAGIVRDGYYAHTCLKCAPAFAGAGEVDYAEVLTARAGEFYESH
ncbi:MAG: tetratricopeptide repeat protein [Lentisphaerae bacterium]|nr:tetratricopeptide repeat protein [Lentisphaerota bacterium]